MNKTIYKIKNLETGEIEIWDTRKVLAEINRDRSDSWREYDEDDDVVSAWKNWVESEEYWQMQNE